MQEGPAFGGRVLKFDGAFGAEGGSGDFAADYSGWRRGLGRRFARFALRAMSIKNYPHRFAKLVPWGSAHTIPGESDSRKLIGLSLFSPFFQSLIQRFPAAAQGLEERYHVGEFLSFRQGIVLVQGQVMALCVQDSHVVGKAVGELVL